MKQEAIRRKDAGVTNSFVVISSLKDEKIRVFSKVIQELQLKDVTLLVITEYNISDIIYDDLEIKSVNVKE